MRDLINLIESTLTEGVGLSNRKPGELFKNAQGEVLTFQSLEFYPQSGRFPSENDLADAVKAMEEQGITINWVNNYNSGVGGFAIARFTQEDDSPYDLGKFFKQISPNRTDNNFAHNDIPGGFQYQSKAGRKENSGLKPSQWLTQFRNNTPETLLQQCIAHFGQNSAEAVALSTFINSDLPVTVPMGNMDPAAFRDYFGEVLQPIALVMGKNVSGNAAEAAGIFFDGGDYSDCTINFNDNAIGGLYDSLLTKPSGQSIKLSSKGKDGAKASAVNLIKSVEELDKAPAGAKIRDKYAKEIAMLETISKLGHFGAPIAIAEEYGIIGKGDGELIMKLKGMGPNDDVTQILNARLMKMYDARSKRAKDMTRIIPIEHMISEVAYTVADYVNANTRFSEAASTILNNSALVQMYTSTRDTKDSITITKLEAIYPSETVTGVELEATKSYMSTQGKGNYVFNVLKNGAKSSKKIDPDQAAAGAAPEPKMKLKDPGASMSADAITRPGREKRSTNISGGRERR